MKTFLYAAVAVLVLSPCTLAQDAAVAQATADLVNQVRALEARVVQLEAQLNPRPVAQTIAQAQPVAFYGQPMTNAYFGGVGGFGACGPQGCGPAPALRGAGLFRRR